MTRAHHAVITGAGVGGIETALALRAAAGDRVHITLVNPEPRFTYRPWSVTEPFTRATTVQMELEAFAADIGIELVVDALAGVEAGDRRVELGGGELSYDSLVLAVGARPIPIVDGAFTFLGPANAGELTALLDEDALGDDARVAFVATASAVWGLPAYELAFYTAARARRSGKRVHVMLVIAEAAPLEAFGEAASRRVAHLLEAAGIELFTETIPASFDGASLFVPMAGTLRCDTAVALPALIGHPIAGVPHDASGFVPVDAHCRVEGVDGVYAVGDMTARPLKQGGLAAQQADVAASAIAAAAGVPIALEPYRPVLHAMLLTGEGHQYLHYPPAERTGLDGPRVTPAWLPHKIAAAHLGPYLATHGELIVQEPGRV